MTTPNKLSRAFYDRPTLEVARDLLGKYIVYGSQHGRMSARIVEVEAYIGQDDPACHASRGLTQRTRPMFGPPGFSYVYFVYGMYHCLNFVTEPEGTPAAVLLRAAEAADGLDLMYVPDGADRFAPDLLAGPGKFCRAFGLTTRHNNLDLTGHDLYLEDRGAAVARVVQSPRVGLKVGVHRPWRFHDGASPAVSRKS